MALEIISKTKTRVDRQTAQRLVAAGFGSEVAVAGMEELGAGMFNALFLLRLVGGSMGVGQELVLKIGQHPDTPVLAYERDIMAAEVAVYRRLEGTGVPTPRVVWYDSSRKHLPAEYFFMEKLEGSTWDSWEGQLTQADTTRLHFALGRAVAEMHTLHGPYFGYIKQEESYHFSSWGEGLSGMVEISLRDGVRAGLALPYAEIRRAVEAHRALLDEIRTPVLTSFDIADKNVMLAQRGEQVELEGIIDHERAFYGDPYADFVSLRTIVGEVEQAVDFKAGYAAFTGRDFVFSPAHRARHCLYSMYMGLLLAVEQYRYDEAVRPHVVQFGLGRIRQWLDALAAVE